MHYHIFIYLFNDILHTFLLGAVQHFHKSTDGTLFDDIKEYIKNVVSATTIDINIFMICEKCTLCVNPLPPNIPLPPNVRFVRS